jgi:type I restriction enzyme, S subunit
MIRWPRTPLGEILRRVERFEFRDDFVEYPFAGTYSFARGIFVGERKLGSSFSLPRVQRLRNGDFVYCKIMAWEGAFGLVPPEADGCVMSGAFVVYEVDRSQIEPKFLDYYFKIPANWKAIGAQSTGTNVRRQSLHPDQFENSSIPLPPLPEQRRIVARIEELAAKINEARGLRQKAKEEVEAFVTSLNASLAGTQMKKLGDILRLDEDLAAVIPTSSYPQVGVKSFGAGLFAKSPVVGSETTYKTFNRLYEGALVLSQVKGCVFRSIRPVIPFETGRLIRSKAAGVVGAKRRWSFFS